MRSYVLPLLLVPLLVPHAARAAGEVHSGLDRQLDVRVPRVDADVSSWRRRRCTRLSSSATAGTSGSSSAIFLRWIGEYDANEQDTLRDDSRTDLPIVVLNRETGLYERQSGFEENRFRNDWLFSYQPTPGTVLFAGYGSTVVEPRNLRFRELRRLSDGFPEVQLSVPVVRRFAGFS